MAVYAISDLHLSFSSDKPMDIFGEVWENYFEIVKRDWNEKVSDEDTVLLAGDLSWAMTLDNALVDVDALSDLKGRKIIIRGNHDYWWQSYTKLFEVLRERNIYALQNNALSFDGAIFCGSRGWVIPSGAEPAAEDVRIYERELIRMELSLKAAEKLRSGDEPTIAMIHYPPFDRDNPSSGFTELFEKFGVSKVIYGHIHGKRSGRKLHAVKNGVEYFLTSCDQTGNRLVRIL